jgi:hypothetical protein
MRIGDFVRGDSRGNRRAHMTEMPEARQNWARRHATCHDRAVSPKPHPPIHEWARSAWGSRSASGMRDKAA